MTTIKPYRGGGGGGGVNQHLESGNKSPKNLESGN